MSILERGIQPDPPLNQVPIIANDIRNQTILTFQTLAEIYNKGSINFWRNLSATPKQLAAELGSDAAEIFALHAKLGSLIASIKPEAIQDGLSVVGKFTINEDGTVTILE